MIVTLPTTQNRQILPKKGRHCPKQADDAQKRQALPKTDICCPKKGIYCPKKAGDAQKRQALPKKGRHCPNKA